MVSPDVFHEDDIEVLVNVDGMPVYRRSRMSMWPIAIQICNPRFEKKNNRGRYLLWKVQARITGRISEGLRRRVRRVNKKWPQNTE